MIKYKDGFKILNRLTVSITKDNLFYIPYQKGYVLYIECYMDGEKFSSRIPVEQEDLNSNFDRIFDYAKEALKDTIKRKNGDR